MDSYSTLPWVKWEAVTAVVVYPDEGYYDTCWIAELWSTQVKVEGIVLQAAWHWGSDSSVVNGPVGELGCTPLYVGLLSTWGSEDGEHVLPVFVGGLLNWGLGTNKPLAPETKHVCIGTLLGNMEGGLFTGGFERKLIY